MSDLSDLTALRCRRLYSVVLPSLYVGFSAFHLSVVHHQQEFRNLWTSEKPGLQKCEVYKLDLCILFGVLVVTPLIIYRTYYFFVFRKQVSANHTGHQEIGKY